MNGIEHELLEVGWALKDVGYRGSASIALDRSIDRYVIVLTQDDTTIIVPRAPRFPDGYQFRREFYCDRIEQLLKLEPSLV